MPSIIPLFGLLLVAAGSSGTESAPALLQSQPPAAAASPIAPAHRESPLSLGAGSRGAHGERQKTGGGVTALVTVGSSLAVVLGLFFLMTWAMRRTSPRASTLLPGEVFEVLGRAPLAARQQVHLLRCGSKLLLVSVTPTGAETLTEVTDTVEVERMAGLCRQSHPHSATTAFRQVFQQFASRDSGRARAGAEAVEDPDVDKATRRAAHRWENDDA